MKLQIVISNRPEATSVTSFGSLLNMLNTPQRAIHIKSNSEQLRDWPAEKIRQKILEIVNLDVDVVKIV